LAGNLGFRSSGLGLLLPEQAKAFAMPAQQGVRLDDTERLFPVGDTAGQQEQPEAITPSELRAFDLALDAKRGELLAQQRILGDEFGSAVGEVRRVCLARVNREAGGSVAGRRPQADGR
jgi:hypothetical protein